MERIYPELVIEAYKATGLKPMRGDFFPEEGCACALGAIYKFMCEDDKTVVLDDYLDHEFTETYIQAFAAGFDGVESKDCYYARNYPEAYKDGVQSWDMVKEKLL